MLYTSVICCSVLTLAAIKYINKSLKFMLAKSIIKYITMMSCMHDLQWTYNVISRKIYTCTTVSPKPVDVDTTDYTHSEGTYTQPVTVACTQLYTH